ncbi:MarR family transcriptional regulator [Corynebacterium anserum]|uniref:Winged helix-turn-helix transcriptional regulator n=1 Tax=Corynebacterium anserum TaxID=2684406 RepID=A0A7G7YQL2_9CORY|nr:winged helix-turn-helix transcriptional regulator [Corynebacterium anserum]
MDPTMQHAHSAIADFRLPTSPIACIYHQIRTAPGIDRSHLSQTLGLSQPTVTRHVSALIEANLVAQSSAPGRAWGGFASGRAREVAHNEEPNGRKKNGRIPTLLHATATHILAIGVHVGGTFNRVHCRRWCWANGTSHPYRP